MDPPRFRDLGDRLRSRARAPRRYPPNGWTIEQTERHLVDQQVEWAVVFDTNRRQLFRLRGTRQTVSFSMQDVALLRDSVVVHNHPREEGERVEDLTFSLTDLICAVRFDIAEMRVVTTGWRFTLRRPEDGWPADETVIGEVYDELFAAQIVAFDGAVAEGLLTDEQARRLAHDETLRLVAQWGRFEYVKEAR
jgi:hypothetical protein